MDEMIDSLVELKLNRLDTMYQTGIITEEQFEAELKAIYGE